jgi:hypothetical protein
MGNLNMGLIPELFYDFVCVYFLENVGYKKFIYLLELLEYNESDLKAAIYNNIDELTNDHNNECYEVTTTTKINK